MKHKEKRMEYARQYQTVNAKECFLGRKEIQFRDGPDGFQKNWLAIHFPKRIIQKALLGRISYDLGGLLISRKT